jgi:hypothetical protein
MRKQRRLLLSATLGLALLPISISTSAAGTNALNVYRAFHTATLLNDGKVLIVGGENSSDVAQASAEIFDPATGIFTLTGSMATARSSHSAVKLSNGKVLIVGGKNSGNTGLSSAEIFDPATGTFSTTGSMSVGRWSPRATLLNSGNVLISGGVPSGSTATKTSEIYNPSTGTFSNSANLSKRTYFHNANLLPSGRVLISAGQEIDGQWTRTDEAEVYDPATDTFTATATKMTQTRVLSGSALLSNGKVIVAGGCCTGGTNADLYDPSTNTFTAIPGSFPNSATHFNPTVIALNNGNAFILGSWESPGDTQITLYIASTNTYTAGPSSSVSRYSHAATLLNDGKVLITGDSTVAEVFDPTNNSLSVPQPASAGRSGNDESDSARREAERQRQEKIAKARSEILETLRRGNSLTNSKLLEADFVTIQDQHLNQMNAELLSLPIEERVNINTVQKKISRFATIEKITGPSARTVLPRELVENQVVSGLIPQKTRILTSILRLEQDQRDSLEKINALVAMEVEKVNARIKRLRGRLSKY